MLRVFSVWLALVVLVGCASVGPVQQSLAPPVLAALAKAHIPASAMGALVVPVGGGVARLAVSENRSMAPGSSIKLLTTLVALEELGPAYRWRTQVYADGPRATAGAFRGNLILKGGGDPNLSWDALRAMVRSLHSMGYATWDGNLVLDRSAFYPMRADLGAPPFDDSPDAYYNVIPDALLVNSNLIEFTLASTADSLSVRTQPPLDGVKIDVRLALNGTACNDWDDHWTYPPVQVAADGSVDLVLTGTFPRDCKARTRVNLLERNLYIERFVRAYWRELGGQWRGRAVDGGVPAGAHWLLDWDSEPLADLVKRINKTSDNAMSRSLYLTLGMTLDQDQRAKTTHAQALTTPQRAQTVVLRWAGQHSLSGPGLVLDNGSGLSRLERITPSQMAAVLQAGAKSLWFPEFAASLPLAGVDGTMRRRLRDSPAASRARIKTGTLRDAVAVAGYVRDVHQQDWVVVGFVNAPDAKNGRAALDALIDWVADGAKDQ